MNNIFRINYFMWTGVRGDYIICEIDQNISCRQSLHPADGRHLAQRNWSYRQSFWCETPLHEIRNYWTYYYYYYYGTLFSTHHYLTRISLIKPSPHINLFIIVLVHIDESAMHLTLIPLTLTLLLGNRGGRREGGSSLIKTEWQQELVGEDGKWKVENEEG